MAAIGDRPSLPPQRRTFEDPPPTARIPKGLAVSKPIFHRFREATYSAWGFTKMAVGVAGDKVSFLFFRVFEWVRPTLGPRVENVFLRIREIWRGVRERWQRDKIRQEMRILRQENRELRTRVRVLTPENQELRRTLSQLEEELTQSRNGADAQVQGLLKQQQNIQDSEQAVVDQRTLLTQRNQQLTGQIEQLTQELTKAQQASAQAEQNTKEAEQRLAQMGRSALDAHDRDVRDAGLQPLLQKISEKLNQLPQDQLKGALDCELDQLLPLLLQQIVETQSKLSPTKGHLPPHHPALVSLESLDRILLDLTSLFTRVSAGFKWHSNFRNPLDQWIQSCSVKS